MILTNASPQIFVGREEILATLNKRIESLKAGYRQNVALTGEKLCGKTSILQHFIANLNDNSLIPVYLEVIIEPLENFAKKFIGTMLFNLLASYEKDTKEDLGYLISKTEAIAPKTSSAIKETLSLLKKEDYQEAYSSLFNLTSILKEETKKSCIIILDEFHNIAFFNLKNPFAIFGKKIMVQKDTMYVVTSSQVSSIKRILKERLDLLFGNFEIIEVRDFEYSVSRGFLERRLEAIRLPDELKDFLILFTDGRPFYLDIIASKLNAITAQLQFKWLSSVHISQALEDLLFDSKGTLNQYFQNLVSTFSQTAHANDYLDIMSAIANGNRKLNQIRQSFGGKKTDIALRINRLIEENLITKNGFVYYLNDRVFEFWLKYVYTRKRHSLVNIFQDRSNLFKKEAENLILNVIAENKKGLHDRLRELLTAFNNEVLKIEEKSLKFPRLDSIEIKDMLEEGAVSIIRAVYEEKNFWAIQINHRFIDEECMAKIINTFKEMLPTAQKRIVIALSGADTNSMLLAKENKIWIWRKETLNSVFALYGKLKILK